MASLEFCLVYKSKHISKNWATFGGKETTSKEGNGNEIFENDERELSKLLCSNQSTWMAVYGLGRRQRRVLAQ